MTTLEVRSAPELRAKIETGTVEGIAVPWDTPTNVGGYVEAIARGSVEPGEIKFFWQHREVIGRVVDTEDREEGLFIRAKISETTTGKDALTLLRDGVVDGLSIGFEPVEFRTEPDGTITRTKIRIKEVSGVTFPAYQDASVSQVREAANTKIEENNMADVTRADVDELRGSIDELSRKVEMIPTSNTSTAPVVDTRSAGEILKGIVAGDETAIRSYEELQKRAYTGGTTADAIVKDGWVGNLTRIFDASSGVLASVFSTGTLPDTGNNIEYAELSANTIDVKDQGGEGADIFFGKVSLTTKTAPVKTYAGGTQLTRQEIERSSVGVLNTSLEALAMAAGARKKLVLRAAYDTLVAARKAIAADAGVVALGATLAAGTASNWEDALIDAAIKFEAQNLGIDALIVSGAVFKKLRSLTVSGERVFQTYRDNASGELNLPGLSGSLAGLPVHLDSGQTGNEAIFVNSRAIRQYDSALVSLSDENIVNLSKSFAVYKYGAVAAEIPAGCVPVKITP